MDINQIIDIFSGHNTINIFLKLFAVIFSLIYLIYTIALQRQVKIMNKTFQTAARFILESVSWLQVILAVFIVLLSFILI